MENSEGKADLPVTKEILKICIFRMAVKEEGFPPILSSNAP
jgi:hypothetical protein